MITPAMARDSKSNLKNNFIHSFSLNCFNLSLFFFGQEMQELRKKLDGSYKKEITKKRARTCDTYLALS
jgi:hypothetical protein